MKGETLPHRRHRKHQYAYDRIAFRQRIEGFFHKHVAKGACKKMTFCQRFYSRVNSQDRHETVRHCLAE